LAIGILKILFESILPITALSLIRCQGDGKKAVTDWHRVVIMNSRLKERLYHESHLTLSDLISADLIL